MKAPAIWQRATWLLVVLLVGGLAMPAPAQTGGPPRITGFTPTSGPVGTTVVIEGSNLNPPVTVIFGGNVTAVGTSTGSTTEIMATVPSGAVTGPIGISTSSGVASTTTDFTVGTSPAPLAFFSGQVLVGSGVYFLAFPNGNNFGYYSYLSDPSYIYSFDLGYEYLIDANDGASGVYLYDFTSSSFFYTSPSFPYPYLYSFSLQAIVYYFQGTTNPRYFYDFALGQSISM